MKKNLLKGLIVATAVGCAAGYAEAQETVAVVEETAVIAEMPCKTHYYTTKRDNWFIQVGAGINSPFVEFYKPNGDEKHHMTATYSLGFGKWFSPYIGWRMAFMGGSMHWDSWKFSRAKYVVGNADIMWDMFNTFHGVNPERTFSIIPFAGIGAFSWDFDAANENIVKEGNKIKKNQWTLPVSAGIQLRFRLSKYVDFFAEGRAQFAGDNFNNTAYGDPVDISSAQSAASHSPSAAATSSRTTPATTPPTSTTSTTRLTTSVAPSPAQQPPSPLPKHSFLAPKW